MGIDVQLRDEKGTVLAEVGDANFLLSRAVTSGTFSGTNLFRYVVPWGDAVFNQAQSADLLIDTRRMISANENAKLTDHLKGILALIERLEKETHSYLWFIGD